MGQGTKLGSKVQSDFNMAYRTWCSNTLLYHFKKCHANKPFHIAVRGVSEIKLEISKGKNIDIVQYEMYSDDVKSEEKLPSLKSVEDFMNSLQERK